MNRNAEGDVIRNVRDAPSEEKARRRRSYPRIRLNRPASVRFSGDHVAEDVVYDVSAGGLQIRCDREVALMVHPSQTVIKENHWPPTRIGVQFPYPEGIPEITVDGSLRYLRVISKDEFAFGVMFEDFLNDGRQAFERFIEASLVPSPTSAG